MMYRIFAVLCCYFAAVSCQTERLVQMTDFCGVRVGKKQGIEIIYEQPITGPFSCCIYMQAAHSSQRLMISFRKILIEDQFGTNGVISEDEASLATTNWCDQSGCTANIRFYDGWAQSEGQFGCTCKDLFPAVMESRLYKIEVCLNVPSGMTADVNFAFFASSFDEGSCTQNDSMLHCVNRRCIQRTLICDTVDNCGDRTDELIGGCGGISGEVGEIYDDSKPLNWDWWWWPLLILLIMMITYWCCWRPGYLWWRLGMCRDIIPFIQSLCRCVFTCTCALNCCGSTCGRHPYKQQMQQNNAAMRAMSVRKSEPKKAKPKKKAQGAMMSKTTGPVTKQPKNPAMMMVEEEEETGMGGPGGAAKDKVYNVKVEYDVDEGDGDGRDRNGAAALLIDEFPIEEWSGMHYREGR
ncbi:uncharacterized protein LOC142337313 [Convolutriloba macropyga]|uniref:uncharacterized protein LOC142337313 n=1 Tax=Convolutriloba macropyga TaxID=536237 RepID=UPI003F51C2AC